MHNLPQLAQKFEVASGKYCQANDIERSDDWVLMKLQEEVGELFQAWLMHTGRGRDKGQTPEELKEMLACETADVLGMILIFAATQGVDLNKYIEKKWRFAVED
ncbi:MAG: pyrophosphatase [Hyphomicrobiales bacterium]